MLRKRVMGSRFVCRAEENVSLHFLSRFYPSFSPLHSSQCLRFTCSCVCVFTTGLCTFVWIWRWGLSLCFPGVSCITNCTVSHEKGRCFIFWFAHLKISRQSFVHIRVVETTKWGSVYKDHNMLRLIHSNYLLKLVIVITCIPALPITRYVTLTK